jgi:hypothetical protein
MRPVVAQVLGTIPTALAREPAFGESLLDANDARSTSQPRAMALEFARADDTTGHAVVSADDCVLKDVRQQKDDRELQHVEVGEAAFASAWERAT